MCEPSPPKQGWGAQPPGAGAPGGGIPSGKAGVLEGGSPAADLAEH